MKTSIHRPVVEKIVSCLFEIFSSSKYADKSIEKFLKTQKKWGSRDRRFFAETVYDLIRYWRRYWNLAGLPDDKFNQIDFINPQVIEKILFIFLAHKKILPADDSKLKTLQKIIQQNEACLNITFISESFTNSFYEWGLKHWSTNQWHTILSALNEQAPVFLRTNNIKITASDLQKKLLSENIETDLASKIHEFSLPDALVLKERKNIFSSSSFQSGLFEIQDASSQLIAPFLQVQPGHRVIDACAGAGGKTLHLASLMKNKGKILSLDIHQWKLDELKKRARRNGIDIIETRQIENAKVIKRLENSADRLLLDVPCSGIGVLRRNPDSKWKLTELAKNKLICEQADILENYSKMLKKNGRLVYSTCSFAPEENQDQIQAFLARHPNSWTLESELKILPTDRIDNWRLDGFYAAALRKVE